MLNMVEVTNNQGDVLSLPMQGEVEGFVVADIEGLDPVKANIVSTSFANVDGEQYQASRREKRNIILTIGLEAAFFRFGSVRELRRELYRYFMPKSEVLMRFHDTDGTFVEIIGRIEDMAAPLFTQDPEAKISILCHNPDFVDPDPMVVQENTVSNDAEYAIAYDGTVDTGFVLRMSPARTMNGFTLYHRLGSGVVQTMEFTAPLSAGDVLEISTVSGAKGATLYRADSPIPILYGISPYSSWPTLKQGLNYMRVQAEGAAVPYTLEFTTKIGGL